MPAFSSRRSEMRRGRTVMPDDDGSFNYSAELDAIHDICGRWSSGNELVKNCAMQLANTLLELGHLNVDDAVDMGHASGAIQHCRAKLQERCRVLGQQMHGAMDELGACLAGMRARAHGIRRACDTACNEEGPHKGLLVPAMGSVTWTPHKYVDVSREVLRMYTQELVLKTHLMDDMIAASTLADSSGQAAEAGRTTLMR